VFFAEKGEVEDEKWEEDVDIAVSIRLFAMSVFRQFE
jgi:hypothetical protein